VATSHQDDWNKLPKKTYLWASVPNDKRIFMKLLNFYLKKINFKYIKIKFIFGVIFSHPLLFTFKSKG